MTTLAEFIDPGIFAPAKIGYGAGSRESPGLPNVLRAMIGDSVSLFDSDTVTLLETNLDRVTSEALGGMVDDLIHAGALDVFVTPILMKKNRPAHLLSVLCENDKKESLAKAIFTSGGTLGMRVTVTGRLKLPRRPVIIKTSGGDVAAKIAEFDGRQLIFPEYDDVVRAMSKANASYDDIYFEIQSTMRKDQSWQVPREY
jgi:uncharacterized protein (DUF111 family)